MSEPGSAVDTAVDLWLDGVPAVSNAFPCIASYFSNSRNSKDYNFSRVVGEKDIFSIMYCKVGECRIYMAGVAIITTDKVRGK